MRMLVKSVLWSALSAAALSAGAAKADVIPYPNIGTINPITYSFTAASSGDVRAYFYGSSAGYEETIGLTVNGTPTGIFGLDNHSSIPGQVLDLGFAPAGATLVFTLQVLSDGLTFSSIPSQNSDSINHVYSTPFSGSGPIAPGTLPIPAGTYLAFEDLAASQGPDYDYNDTQFVVTTAPELSTWAMMLIGFAGIGFVAYRRRRVNGEMLAST